MERLDNDPSIREKDYPLQISQRQKETPWKHVILTKKGMKTNDWNSVYLIPIPSAKRKRDFPSTVWVNFRFRF